MPILTPGQERKRGRCWAWVAVAMLGLLILTPIGTLGAATLRPITMRFGKHQFAVYYGDDRSIPQVVIPPGITGGYYSYGFWQWNLHLLHADWTITWLRVA